MKTLWLHGAKPKPPKKAVNKNEKKRFTLNILSIDSDSDIILNDDNVENVSSSGSSCKFMKKQK